MNLNSFIDKISDERGSDIAMYFPGADVSYAKFLEAVRRLARGLTDSGVEKGDRVAVMLPNLPQFPIAYYAILRIGAVVVPVNMMYKGREVGWLLEDSEAKILIAWGGLWSEIERHVSVIDSVKKVILLGQEFPGTTESLTAIMAKSNPLSEIVDTERDDPAIIQYTAGVTGTPKGAELTHYNIFTNLKACQEMTKTTPKDVLLTAMPFFHPVGQTLLMNLALCSGAALNIVPRFDPETIVKEFEDGRCTLFIGVPSMYKLLLNQAEPLPEDVESSDTKIRLSICGGGAINDDLLKEFEKRFGTYILECYTMSETSPVTSFNQWRTGRRVGSLGHPIPGVEMKIVNEKGVEASIGEVGEIIIKGENVMRRYINRPNITAEVLRDGWYHTRDLGKMDINGFFYLVDRLGDRIIKGGFSIYPTEIEDILYGHPDVKEAAVIGVEDEIMGEEVKACVVLKDGSEATTEQLSEYCKERMALYKVPAVIRFFKDLPHTAGGKIDKAELKNY
ncbi:long-chain fatty acid--CoA ligase [Calditrichota bacterium]